jgi:hypothetical protein
MQLHQVDVEYVRRLFLSTRRHKDRRQASRSCEIARKGDIWKPGIVRQWIEENVPCFKATFLQSGHG